jgi:hypothetical protein
MSLIRLWVQECTVYDCSNILYLQNDMDTKQITRVNSVGSKGIDKYFYDSTYKKVGEGSLDGFNWVIGRKRNQKRHRQECEGESPYAARQKCPRELRIGVSLQ